MSIWSEHLCTKNMKNVRQIAREDFKAGLPIDHGEKVHGFKKRALRQYLGAWVNEKNNREAFQNRPPKALKAAPLKQPQPILYPCRFCGSDAVLNTTKPNSIGRFAHFVICINMECGCSLRGFISKSKAIKTWNTRSSQMQVVTSDSTIPTSQS